MERRMVNIEERASRVNSGSSLNTVIGGTVRGHFNED